MFAPCWEEGLSQAHSLGKAGADGEDDPTPKANIPFIALWSAGTIK